MSMQESDLGLMYVDSINPGYFDNFKNEVNKTQAQVFVESREDGPQAAIEWGGFQYIMMFIGIHLFDAYAKKVSEDIADATYPRIKRAVTDLIKKVFVREPLQPIIFATGEEKIKNPKALHFSVYAQSKGRRGQQKLKFLFERDLTEEECEAVVEQMFAILEGHYATTDSDDPLSRNIAALDKSDVREVYLLNSKEEQKWKVVDPAQQIHQVGISGSKPS